jgi:hypothetical protein
MVVANGEMKEREEGAHAICSEFVFRAMVIGGGGELGASSLISIFMLRSQLIFGLLMTVTGVISGIIIWHSNSSGAAGSVVLLIENLIAPAVIKAGERCSFVMLSTRMLLERFLSL